MKQKANEMYRSLVSNIDKKAYGETFSAPEFGQFKADVVAYLAEKTFMNAAQANELFVKASANCTDYSSCLRAADELADLFLAVDRRAVEQNLTIGPLKGHGCCYSCGAFNYQPKNAELKRCNVPVFDIYVREEGFQLCPTCLSVLIEKASDLIQDEG